MDAHLYHIVDLFPPKHGHLLNLLATPVNLCKGWQSGSNIHIAHHTIACTYSTLQIMVAPYYLNRLLTHVILVRVACGSRFNTCAL